MWKTLLERNSVSSYSMGSVYGIGGKNLTTPTHGQGILTMYGENPLLVYARHGCYARVKVPNGGWRAPKLLRTGGNAATLANGGVNPLTGQVVVERQYVKNTLSVMFTGGMYDYSVNGCIMSVSRPMFNAL